MRLFENGTHPEEGSQFVVSFLPEDAPVPPPVINDEKGWFLAPYPVSKLPPMMDALESADAVIATFDPTAGEPIGEIVCSTIFSTVTA